MRYVVYGLLLLLYLLHTDVWYWNDGRVALGLPIGVTYHVVWTLLVSGAFWLAVQYAWPSGLDDGEGAVSAAAGQRGAGRQRGRGDNTARGGSGKHREGGDDVPGCGPGSGSAP